MKQRDRVLAALRRHPERGITQVDFLRHPTIDGGPPITRVAPRVLELRQEGHAIEEAGWRDKCLIYRLKEVAPCLDGACDEPSSGRLFDMGDARPTNAIYGDPA